MVHDTQDTYRNLLNSMSRPGTISPVIGEVQAEIPFHHATFLTALTLLDAEVRFHVVGDQEHVRKAIADYTLARSSTVEEADYIIVPNGTKEETLFQALKNCKVGSLVDPQNASTWIIEQEELSQHGSLTLTGPGIQNEASLQLDVTEKFWGVRREKVKEFPLGIDLIFTDARSLACIPRTTKVSVTGGVM